MKGNTLDDPRRNLSIVEAHFHAESDKYDAEHNPKGFINFGVSINALNMQSII